MADESMITWTHSTFNPWMGCAKVSAGCKNCYAEQLMDKRYGTVEWGVQGKRVKTSVPYWRKPLIWNGQAGREGVRRRVFCGSLCDVFEDTPQVANWRGELFGLIEKTQNLDWLLLTKRPERIFSLGTDAVGEIFDNWMARNPHVWLGTSVENEEVFDQRVEALTSVFARVHFLSMEPLLGPVKLRFKYHPVDWVIVGGESGAKCRSMDVEWARDIMKYCRQYDIRFFMKQMGGHPNKRESLESLPDDLRVREYPHG